MRLVASTLVIAIVVAATMAAATQEHQHSPYAGHESSEIPALTPDELAQLEAGEGMGLAKAAELNHYPGPRHVLDLGSELGLSDEQRRRVQGTFDAMQAQARDLGARIIAAERELDTRFKHGHIDPQALRDATATIAALYGELRYVHLNAHLSVTELLDPEQVGAYDRLRGYGGLEEQR